MQEVAETCDLSGQTATPVVTDIVTPQLMSEDFVRERTSVSSPPTSVISYQRKLHLSLSELTVLSYRVTDESCLRQNLTELRAVVSAM